MSMAAGCCPRAHVVDRHLGEFGRRLGLSFVSQVAVTTGRFALIRGRLLRFGLGLGFVRAKIFSGETFSTLPVSQNRNTEIK